MNESKPSCGWNDATPYRQREAQPPLPPACRSVWYALFEYMSKNHGLKLLDDELNTIAFVADESRLKTAGGVNWILVNALRHLTCDELHDLGEAIAKRSGGTYTSNVQSSPVVPRGTQAS